MKIRFKNAKILKNAFADITEGEVHIDGGAIVYVGKEKPFEADAVKDCGGNLLIPSFANAHAHSAMTLFRGAADDLPLKTWLYDRIFPLEDHLTEEDVYWGNLLAAAEYVRGGVTAVADMYFYDDVILETLRDKAGLRWRSVRAPNDIGGGTEQELENIEAAYNKYRGERLKYFIGLHAEYTCSDALLEGVADLSAKYGAPTYIHCAETLGEVGECSVRRALTPVEYLHKIGFFDNGGIIAHGTYLDKNDIALLNDKNVWRGEQSFEQFKACERRRARIFHAEKRRESRARHGRRGKQQQTFHVQGDVSDELSAERAHEGRFRGKCGNGALRVGKNGLGGARFQRRRDRRGKSRRPCSDRPFGTLDAAAYRYKKEPRLRGGHLGRVHDRRGREDRLRKRRILYRGKNRRHI